MTHSDGVAGTAAGGVGTTGGAAGPGGHASGGASREFWICKTEGGVIIEAFVQILVIIAILIGGGLLAKSYFDKAKLTKQDQDIWKKNAINHNKDLDNAFNKKDDKSYGDLLHPKASRFQPKIPYRIDGAAEVLKKIRTDMEKTGGTITILQPSNEVYKEVLLVTYNYMTDGKVGEKFLEGSGKVTRVWARVDNSWKLVHEHVSEN